MKKTWLKIVSLVLVISTFLTALPMTTFSVGVGVGEVYIKSVQLARAETKEEAKSLLEDEGYIFLDANLNEGTGEDGIWMGYTTTTHPEEAIYDLKLMNMNGGFTLTSMEEALAAQEAVFAGMANDLNYLLDEFVEAYEDESIPALKAYKALNFFRVVEGETELEERNGLGYQIVSGNMTVSKLTEMLLLCDATLVDSVIKILVTGVQIRNGNWMKKLSEMGPYDADEVYYEDEYEDEFKRRAEELLPVLQLYSQAYNAMDLSGLIPDKLNEDFEAEYSGNEEKEILSADDAAVKKLDESRYKMYKIVFDELAKYPYGTHETLKDFFCSLENEGSTKDLYPLVAVLSDAEFAALSYGCFLEVVTGATATPSDFDSYDEVYDVLTEDVKSVYLYHGVDDILLTDDTVIGFTETATRHMATTGEMEFFEKETDAEQSWEDGKNASIIIASVGMGVMGIAKITTGVAMGIMTIASAVESSVASSAILTGIIKYGTMMGGIYAMLVVAVAVGISFLVSFIWSVVEEEINGSIDWDENPMPKYMYDVKEVGFSQNSVNDGIATEYLKKPVFALYKAVTDKDGEVVDLNARSKDATQWIAMYASYDRQGDDAKPIKADDLLVKTGSGETPEGYAPLTRFGEVIAYNLNQWDEDDDVNGVYLFYQQDQSVSVDSGKTYYIYDVYLQSGESDSHCIELLKAAGYTPLNVNLSPDLYDDDVVFKDKIYTYLGYKTTTNKDSAICDIRLVYGPPQGQIQLGGATYADCGSNGQVTLYSTKYDSAGTALLAGGIICVDNPSKAPAGHEPVCLMAGGPAVSLNMDNTGKVNSVNAGTYLYFLPETTFVSGTRYISDISFFYVVRNPSIHGLEPKMAPLELQHYFHKTYTILDGGYYKDMVGCYATYNPYRAIYDVKAIVQEDFASTFSLGGLGYVEANKIACTYIPQGDKNVQSYDLRYGNVDSVFTNEDMNGTLYLTGNTDSQNTYSSETNSMTKVQPLKVSDIICAAPFQKSGYHYDRPTIPDNYTPVSNLLTNSKDAAQIMLEKGNRKYEFYIAKETKQKPYVSNIFAVDALSLFRANGGYEKGIDTTDITESMMISQLANMGATNFCSEKIDIKAWGFAFSALKFGYNRTDGATNSPQALTDVFLYFNKFSTDEPPKELYRGNVTYTLVCEIPYNLTGYNEAPKPGIYLYGTTSSKAGKPIVDFDISTTPFFEGYETVRTKDGRSLWSEVLDYLGAQMNAHPMGGAQDMYEELVDFFSFSRGYQGEIQENGYFYLHIKREGDDLRKQKPYVEEIYLTSDSYDDYYNVTWAKLYEELFDMGAEACITVDLNKRAGGDVILMGYSYTADPNTAIRDIWAYHEKNPPKTLNGDNGVTYDLVKDLDLNKGAGGDYIYLYATKNAAAGMPITALTVDYDVVTGTNNVTWVDGQPMKTYTSCVKRWDTNSYSDLNRKGGGEYIYLMFTGVDTDFEGTFQEPQWGQDKIFSRDEYKNVKLNGKYIGGLYVMDKNTILQEKIAAGTLAEGATCDTITDDEVKERLTEMGAHAIIDTPIVVTGEDYFENNKNKVYIGYSYTNTLKRAIRGIAIKTEILSLHEPANSISVDGNNYDLVAEAASEVSSLPRAINLIGTDNQQDTLLPRMYLYYSTSVDNDPICDITIDSDPIKNGWLTATSANVKDPFTDISEQAKKHYELARAENIERGNGNYAIYVDELCWWMADISRYFDPAKENLTPFYIHTNHYKDTTVEEAKPYISGVFLAVGDTRHAALADMVQYGVDGYIDCDLNLDAGGDFVYLGYKRTDDVKEALTDLVVFEGDEPEANKRLNIKDKTIKYTLASEVDLNSNAGGKWLYLYSSDSADTGNPIKALRVEEKIASYLKCGVEEVTVKRAEGKVITNENIDLNKRAGGKYLYLIMNRETTAGHDYSILKKTKDVPATCGEDGALTGYYECSLCGADGEVVEKVYPATGKHQDEDGDGNHKCDECGAKNVSAHVEGEVQREDEEPSFCKEQGSYHLVVYCVECEDELRNTVLYLPLDPDNHKDSKDADHNCDYCGLKIEDHTAGKPVEESRIEPTEKTEGSYKKVVYCKECNEKLSEEIVILPALKKADPKDSEVVASLFGDGSIVVICSFLGFAVLAAILIYVQKKKKVSKGEKEND